jgi:hypothetical protein
MTIDMKSYAGEVAPAAVERETNTYQDEAEYPFPLPPESAPEQPELIPAAVEPQTVVQEESEGERNFKALRESVEKLKAEREEEKRDYQAQLDMLRANQRPEAKPKQMFEGMDDSDIPNVGELRKVWNERERVYRENIEEMQVASRYPDYVEVLNKYGTQLAKNDPLFVQGVQGAENKALFAYQYAKREQRLQELESLTKQSATQVRNPEKENVQKMIDNSKKPGTLAKVGSQSVLSQSDYYASMSDADFVKFASKHLD